GTIAHRPESESRSRDASREPSVSRPTPYTLPPEFPLASLSSKLQTQNRVRRRRPASGRSTGAPDRRSLDRPRPPVPCPAASGAPALRVDQQVGVGVGLAARLQLIRADASVDVTFAQPDLHVVAAERLLQPRAQEEVRQEQDLLPRWDRADHRLGVAAGDAVV